MSGSVYISIGSNTGDKVANIRRALALLSERQFATVEAVSPFYSTKPWGKTDQDSFVNCAARLATFLAPEKLLTMLKLIETEMGRTHTGKWGPRVIDLDIIFYGHEVIKTEELTIPHIHMHERPFVMIPLNDIAPEVEHPVFGVTVGELAAEFFPSEDVSKMEEKWEGS
ncbi:MAG: 2-amino-4-hydroxy-6-hydroxymethyldihydropteridine diphosphokinase [Deltaproteobacteria bacterium]|nr:2-amino-4-hydroxy-6-hydroxymethyldihydropteridine diphosphokinase [Deltaproteobacteria bacterium]